MVPVDISPLLDYFERRKTGSWSDFDRAVRGFIPGLYSRSAVFEFANRLSAYCMLDFDWKERSWYSSPAIAVDAEITIPSSFRRPVRSRRLSIYGATRSSVEAALSSALQSPTYDSITFDINRYQLSYPRAILPVTTAHLELLQRSGVALYSDQDLEVLISRLPSIRVAADTWTTADPDVDAALLRGFSTSEIFDFRANTWVARDFDETSGLWRVEGNNVRRYYHVFRGYGSRQSLVHIVRVPPDLGRWFVAPNPGSAHYAPASSSLTISLTASVIDVPTLHERALTLLGARRLLIANYPREVTFVGVEQAVARTVSILLGLKWSLS